MRAACSCVAWLAFPLLAAGGIAGEPVRVSLWTVEVPVATVVAWQRTAGGDWFAAAQAEVAAGRGEEAGLVMVSGKEAKPGTKALVFVRVESISLEE